MLLTELHQLHDYVTNIINPHTHTHTIDGMQLHHFLLASNTWQVQSMIIYTKLRWTKNGCLNSNITVKFSDSLQQNCTRRNHVKRDLPVLVFTFGFLWAKIFPNTSEMFLLVLLYISCFSPNICKGNQFLSFFY